MPRAIIGLSKDRVLTGLNAPADYPQTQLDRPGTAAFYQKKNGRP